MTLGLRSTAELGPTMFVRRLTRFDESQQHYRIHFSQRGVLAA